MPWRQFILILLTNFMITEVKEQATLNHLVLGSDSLITCRGHAITGSKTRRN